MKVSTQVALESAGQSILMVANQTQQMLKTCEELAELTVALSKRLNYGPVTDGEIVDEIADVLIMVNQMRLVYGPDQVDERISYKLGLVMEKIRTLGRTSDVTAPSTPEDEL